MDLFIPPTVPRRQPPHPHRRAAINEKEEEEEEERNTGQQIEYCLRRCKRRKSSTTNIESSSSSLPDDAWYEILSHLPAQKIYDMARLVCWKWYRMIYTHTFIYANLQHTPYGLLFGDRDGETFFMTMQQGQIETSNLSYGFSSPYWSTCNGLTLEMAGALGSVYHVINPLTKQVFVLPPAPRIVFWFCGIGYTPVSMEYKAVTTSLELDSKDAWLILTIGVDSSWRVVRTDHFRCLARMLSMGSPFITEGFMHWAGCSNRTQRKVWNQVLSLDVETEILTKSCVPFEYGGYDDHWTYLSTGKFLTVLITCGECLWEVWEMKSGEWRKMDGVIIDLGTKMFELFGFEIVPVGWLNDLEVLVFRVISYIDVRPFTDVRSYIFVYNLLTKETSVFELPNVSLLHNPVLHKNSLVWLAGC
ncbi:hypothetical protein CASFOL_027862 [Castilleja foliolosa]|uniref:F-box domain-containing protein n=1 Tax=Castilleja foliolosa TaxID=1961234 RepID=A0ABD3CHN6_9LAMI